MKSKSSTGSPKTGEPVYLVVGKLRRPHGIHGEMVMEILTDFPERLQVGTRVFVGREYRELQIRSRRPHQNFLLVAFQGYDTPEEVGVWRNKLVYVLRVDRPPLEEDEFYHHELIGLEVEIDAQTILGTVTSILETGANDVLVVRPEKGAEILLPLTDEVVQEIDLQTGRMRVKLLPGLLP